MKTKFCQPTRITHDGLTLTIKEWGERLGVDHRLIYARLASGWSPTDAVSFGPRQRDKLHHVNGEWLKLNQCAERAGVSYGTFISRLVRGLTLKEAVEVPKGKHIRLRRGVVSNLEAFEGTGGGSTAQEIPNIDFSQDSAE